MSQPLEGAVELLERSLAYTRGTLAGVRPELLDGPTPCVGWTLGQLMAHMEDALDAFTEAAGGAVKVDVVGTAFGRVAAIQDKACRLLGVWTRPAPGDVVITGSDGDLDLGSPLLVATAALEVTVHGWDVSQATGTRHPIPDDLARELLPLAHAVVGPADRLVRFAPPQATAADAPYDVRLLAFLGRG